MRYICALPNEKKPGRFPERITDDDEAIAAFAKRWDVPGKAVYMCPNPLLPDARRRSLDTVAAITVIFADIDFKDLEEAPEDIEQRLQQLPLQPTWVRASGGGFHVGYELKEPIERTDDGYFRRAQETQKRLVACLSADTAPSHPAALLRVEGTHNTKRGEPVLCETLWGSSEPVDLTDIEAMIEQLPADGMFTRRAVNGRDRHPPQVGEWKAPTDVAERLAAMRLKGPGDSSIHKTQLACTASLLRNGCTLDHVVDEVLQATRKAVADDKRAAKWDWAQEEYEVCRMCADFINKLHPELYILLPDTHRVRWEAAVAEGKQPRLVFSRGPIGWHVRGLPGNAAATAETGEKQKSKNEKAARPGAKRLALQPFVPFDPATLPPRQWLYAKHYQRRTVSLTAGPGGLGKSSLVLVECIAMATCRDLLGEQPAERLKIWLHNGEDPIEEIHRRLAAICQHYRIPMEELQGQLWITSGNEFPLRVAKGYSNLEIDAALVKEISNAIGDNQIDVAAFDPLVTLHSVSEGDPGKMDAVVRLFAGIADEHNAGIELNHHVRKPAAGTDADHDVHDIRGVMAITDAVRAARVLNRMNKADAENAGIDEIARLSHFRVDKAKGNYSPAQAATWRRFVSVDLPNTDSVGVVAPWDFPGQGTPSPEKTAADQKAERVFLQLLDKFLARGVNVSANSGPNYAPAKFAAERETTAAKVSKAALKAAMTRLLDAGRIRPEPIGRGDRASHRLVPRQES